MSYYATMDHAGWVERNIAAYKVASKRKGNTKGWRNAPDKLNDFQRKVMDILGMTFGGIYNAPISWDAVEWRGWGQGIAVPLTRGRGELATWDSARLTRFVFLCHEARIRGEVHPHSFGMKLTFFPRSAHGSSATRHPNLTEAIEDFRKYLPPDHAIIYRESAEPLSARTPPAQQSAPVAGSLEYAATIIAGFVRCPEIAEVSDDMLDPDTIALESRARQWLRIYQLGTTSDTEGGA